MKKVEQHEPTKQYRPADAVRKRGDNWRYGAEVWALEPSMYMAVGDFTHDHHEAALMRLMEKGWYPRCD